MKLANINNFRFLETDDTTSTQSAVNRVKEIWESVMHAEG